MEKTIKLGGRIFLHMNVHAETGLHIGGSSSGMEIGGVDNPVIRDVLTNRPYIPGSSLRGKMRSQLEKVLGAPQNTRINQSTIHTCQDETSYQTCNICNVFGTSGKEHGFGPTRLVVRDANLTKESAKKLDGANTDLAYTELKTEVAIDRITSAASPRNIERVPAGAEFGPLELVFSIYDEADFDRFKMVLNGLQLVEDDYLGGSGSRGSGKVNFRNIEVSLRSSEDYGTPQGYQNGQKFDSIQSLLSQEDDLSAWMRQQIQTG